MVDTLLPAKVGHSIHPKPRCRRGCSGGGCGDGGSAGGSGGR